MTPFKEIISRYSKVEKPILFLIGAEFFLQILNSSFFLLFNFHMDNQGYQDYEISDTIAVRFLMVLILGFPLGILFKHVKIKPFFIISTILTPLSSLLIIYAVYQNNNFLIYSGMIMWGISFAFFQIGALPFLLMYAKKETHSEAISLFFLTWCVAISITGILYNILNNYFPHIFDVGTILYIYSSIAWISVYMILKIDVKEKPKAENAFQFSKLKSEYDWDLILKAIIPTLVIAIGAGFTIPVINLFFLNVHGVDAEEFSVYGSLTYILVAIGMVFMPYIKRNFGYQIAITLFQSLAVLALFFLAITEYFNHWDYALYIAVFFYIIRQPLMNVAGPMTSELTMYYVGKKNQELISALNASIWSGSWLLSMKLFSWLRQLGYKYVSIFLITVVLYIIGILWYAFLIKDYQNRQEKEKH